MNKEKVILGDIKVKFRYYSIITLILAIVEFVLMWGSGFTLMMALLSSFFYFISLQLIFISTGVLQFIVYHVGVWFKK